MSNLSNLILTDPLAEETVRLHITILPQAVSRSDKGILLTLSVADQPPWVETGKLRELPDLIQQAWHGYGIRQQAQPSTELPDGEAKLLAEATVSAPSSDTPTTPAPPKPTPMPQPPKPPKNLSLF